MQRRVDADGAVALEKQRLRIGRARLHDRLILIVMLQAIGVFAIAAVARAPARLHVGRAPRRRAEGAQGRRRVERARAHFDIVRLQDDAALLRPEGVQAQDDLLETRLGVERVH